MTLEITDITKVVAGRVHIKPTTLSLSPGHFNVLLGETGAGKTSLIKMMAGLDPIAGGTIRIQGDDVTRLSTQARNISLVHQFFVNYPHMSVFDNIASPLKVAGMARSEIDGRVQEVADILKLGPMLKRYPHELSGGQQQRCALARAMAKDARAVFLDEPLANLDYKLREELREELPSLFAGRGAVVVYATSEPEEALLLGGETALMQDGRVVQFGPTADIYRAPATLSAAQVFSDPPINTADVVKAGGEMRLTDAVSWPVSGAAQSLADGPYKIAVRPHHVTPYETPANKVKLNGTVLVTELSGSESSAHFRTDAGDWVSLAHGVHAFEVGEDHPFYLDPGACFLFAPDGARLTEGAQ